MYGSIGKSESHWVRMVHGRINTRTEFCIMGRIHVDKGQGRGHPGWEQEWE